MRPTQYLTTYRHTLSRFALDLGLFLNRCYSGGLHRRSLLRCIAGGTAHPRPCRHFQQSGNSPLNFLDDNEIAYSHEVSGVPFARAATTLSLFHAAKSGRRSRKAFWHLARRMVKQGDHPCTCISPRGELLERDIFNATFVFPHARLAAMQPPTVV